MGDSPKPPRKQKRKSTRKARPAGFERPLAGQHRVEFVLHLRDEGKRHGYIVPAVRERYGVSRSQAEEDLRRADSIIVKRLEADAPVIAGRMMARLERIVDDAEDRGDAKAAIAAIAEIREWSGVGSTINMGPHADPGSTSLLGAIKLTPAQRNQREAELLKILGDDDLGPLPSTPEAAP